VKGAAVAAACALSACAYPVDPAECAIDADCTGTAFCFAGSCRAGTRTCPTLAPTYSSIDRNLFKVGCGTSGSKAANCHSREGAVTTSGLDLIDDPYSQMVNQRAFNLSGSIRGLIVVKPGDPQSSFLVTKLHLTTASDPAYGAGMPADAPGSICQSAQDAVAQWIQNGAGRN